jgi:hypothetical protein
VDPAVDRRTWCNHTYPRRPVDAHPDFYALSADGDAFPPSASLLHFANRTGDGVYRLSEEMQDDFEAPQRVE